MNVIIIKNGVIRILLQPEDEIEKLVLADISKNPIIIEAPDRIDIAGTNYSDSVILTSKPIDSSKIP